MRPGSDGCEGCCPMERGRDRNEHRLRPGGIQEVVVLLEEGSRRSVGGHIFPGSRIRIGDGDYVHSGVLEQRAEVCEPDDASAPDYRQPNPMRRVTRQICTDQEASILTICFSPAGKVLFSCRLRRGFR